MRWQLQDAKNKFSQVLRYAQTQGPQIVTLRGVDAVVILDIAEYRRLTATSDESLVEFLQRSPFAGVDLDVTRSTDTGRDLDL